MTRRPADPGHVFVVHGDLRHLAHDAVAVPTDAAFSGVQRWTEVVGAPPERPRGWRFPGRRWGSSRDRVWYVDVGRKRGDDVDWLIEGVTGVLRAMAEEGARPRSAEAGPRRARPLLAMPVMGIGRGGFSDERGEVVQRLLAAAREVAAEKGVDVALVTPDPAVHGALQHVRRQTTDQQSVWQLEPDSDALATALADRARSGGLALFLGAGVSVPAGLPTWKDLLALLGGGPGAKGPGFDQLGVLDQAQVLSADVPGFARAVASACRTDRHAIGHALLAALGCREAVTTNYDHCYELACAAVRPREGAVTTVMPREVPTGGTPWLLKLHGDVDRPESIVLSRRDFVRYDATSRPAAALLQALLLTRHLLVVGASLTDDNVLRLTHEVSAFREHHGLSGAYGTVLDVDDAAARGSLWRGELDWRPMPGTTVPERARMVEVLLDAVASRATTDASWLLDERFSALLSPEERALAAAVRSVRGRLPDDGGPWSDLRGLLDERGASVRG